MDIQIQCALKLMRVSTHCIGVWTDEFGTFICLYVDLLLV